MLSFIYIYSLQQPSCIMIAIALLRCYQHHRCYDHIWVANCSLSRLPLHWMWTLTIYLFYNLCRFPLELCTNILTMIILSSFKVTSTIYLFYNLCRCILVLSYTRYTHINNDLSFYPSRWSLLYIYFTISVDFSLLYWLALSTSILIMIHPLSRWSSLFYFTISTFLY